MSNLLAIANVTAKAPKSRSSKACETCRTRRIRCLGKVPCDPCRTAGFAATCHVRIKARPKRAISSKLATVRQDIEDVSDRVEAFPLPSPPPSFPRLPTNPLRDIESGIGTWCTEKGVPFTKLVFTSTARLEDLQQAVLPQSTLLQQLEDSLISQLITQPQPEQLSPMYRPRLLSLYARYRAMPNTLTEAQKAFIYGALCLSRYTQARTEDIGGSGTSASIDQPREDVTYFWMAWRALEAWNRPSIHALWALFCLIPLSIGLGGSQDTKHVLEQAAWQSKELGLNRQCTASLYPSEDLLSPLFSALMYQDIFCAALTDLTPCLSLSDIDVDFTPPLTVAPDCLSRASTFTAAFLKCHADPSIDVMSDAFVTTTESEWMRHLRELRDARHTISDHRVAWAEFRYNWLRILLYTPRLASSLLAPQAYAVISRAVTQILHTYADVVSINQLNPSWPQIHRLVVCGQLLILSQQAGELHRLEAQYLFRLVIDLLDKHKKAWPICCNLMIGFWMAAQVFNLDVGPDPSPTGLGILSSQNIDAVEQAGLHSAFWNEFVFEFDPATLFALSYDDLEDS